MEHDKQKTIKRHFFLVAAGTVGMLTLLSLSAPFESTAPPMPADEFHRSSQKVIECLNCHRSNTAAAEGPVAATTPKPMRHEVRANCAFCHPRL